MIKELIAVAGQKDLERKYKYTMPDEVRTPDSLLKPWEDVTIETLRYDAKEYNSDTGNYDSKKEEQDFFLIHLTNEYQDLEPLVVEYLGEHAILKQGNKWGWKIENNKEIEYEKMHAELKKINDNLAKLEKVGLLDPTREDAWERMDASIRATINAIIDKKNPTDERDLYDELIKWSPAFACFENTYLKHFGYAKENDKQELVPDFIRQAYKDRGVEKIEPVQYQYK